MFETRAHECKTYWPLCVCNVTDNTTISLWNYEAGSFLYEMMADNNCFDRRDCVSLCCGSSLSHSTMRRAWAFQLPCAAVASQNQMAIVQRSYRRWNCRCLVWKSWKSSSCHQKTLAALLFWRWHHAYCMLGTRLAFLHYGSVGSDMDSSRRHTKQLTISVPYLLVI